MRRTFGVALNADGSIVVCIWGDAAMASEGEKRADELGIEATISREYPTDGGTSRDTIARY